jgi:hypothetical protein
MKAMEEYNAYVMKYHQLETEGVDVKKNMERLREQMKVECVREYNTPRIPPLK